MPLPERHVRIHPRFFVDSVRLEEIIHIDAALCDDIFIDPVRSRLHAEFNEVREALILGDQSLRGLRTATNVDDLAAILARIAWDFEAGFMVKARQPYFIVDSEGVFGYSWELSRTQWFFARAYETVLERVYQWASANHAEAHVRLAGASGAARLSLPGSA
jgi:hypothetical protein